MIQENVESECKLKLFAKKYNTFKLNQNMFDKT